MLTVSRTRCIRNSVQTRAVARTVTATRAEAAGGTAARLSANRARGAESQGLSRQGCPWREPRSAAPSRPTLLAAQTAGLLNAGRLTGELTISAPTVRSYLSILETIFMVKLVPAWSSGATTRAVGTPKMIFVDSGLAAHLTAGLAGDTQLGGLLENFALSELARQLTWSQTSARLYHYRDRYEVDAILENSAGEIIGVEVKAAETVRGTTSAGSGSCSAASAPASAPDSSCTAEPSS